MLFSVFCHCTFTEISLDFGLLVGQNEQFKDATLGFGKL